MNTPTFPNCIIQSKNQSAMPTVSFTQSLQDLSTIGKKDNSFASVHFDVKNIMSENTITQEFYGAIFFKGKGWAPGDMIVSGFCKTQEEMFSKLESIMEKRLTKLGIVQPVKTPVTISSRYASAKQKEEIIKLLNNPYITRQEKTKMLLQINRLDEANADKVILKLKGVIEEREDKDREEALAS